MIKYKKIFFFVAALFLLLSVLEKIFSITISGNKYIKLNYVTRNKIDAEIIFIGSCEMLTTVSPKIIEKNTGLTGYNLSQNHANVTENYLSLYLYLKNNKAPKYVFLYTSPETFDVRFNCFNGYRFVSFLEDEEVNDCVKKFDYNYWVTSNFPFGKFAYYNSKFLFPAIQGAKHVTSKKAKPYFKDGYEPFFKIWEFSINKYKENYKSDLVFKMDESRIRYLEKSIELCKSKNIQLILMETPMYKYSNQLNRKEIIKEIEQLAVRNKVPFYCFDTMGICQQKINFMTNFEPTEKPSRFFNELLGSMILDLNKKK